MEMQQIERTPLSIVKQTLRRQDEQGKALIAVVEHVEKIEKKMNAQYLETKKLVKDVSEQVTLNEAETIQLMDIVRNQAVEFTKEYFDNEEVGRNLFLSKLGQFRRLQWKRLKSQFNVRKYVLIKHVDFEEARAYLKTIQFKDFEKWETGMTVAQEKMLGGN